MLTFGSDPEFVVTDKNDFVYSAIGIVHGSTENRICQNGHQFYYDNVMAECAVKPSKTKEETIKNFKDCFEIFSKMLNPYKLSPVASMFYTKDQLECSCVGEHFLCAKYAGCEADWCAYQMELINPPVDEIENGFFRTCGGHIHLGYNLEKLSGHNQFQIIYLLDLLLGVPSLYIDKNNERRKLYGKAGRYREKDYGVEYRTLSNFWLSKPKLVEIVWDICNFTIDFVAQGKADNLYKFNYDKFYENQDADESWEFVLYDKKELQDCINESNKNKAQKFFELSQTILDPKIAKDLRTICEKETFKTSNLHESWGLLT